MLYLIKCFSWIYWMSVWLPHFFSADVHCHGWIQTNVDHWWKLTSYRAVKCSEASVLFGRKVGKSYCPSVSLASDVLCASVSLHFFGTSRWILGLRTCGFSLLSWGSLTLSYLGSLCCCVSLWVLDAAPIWLLVWLMHVQPSTQGHLAPAAVLSPHKVVWWCHW